MKNIKKVLIFVLFVFASVLALNLSVKAAAGDVYKLVTDAATLAAGDEVIIAKVDGTYAMSTNQKSNNRGAVAVSASGDIISFVENLEVLTLKQGNASGTFALCGLNGKYLTITTSNGKSNYLRSSDTIDELSSWKISITDGVANIEANTTTYARKYMKYNPNNGSPLFSCYSSGQQDIAIYKKASVGANATQLATPVATLNGKTVSWGAIENAEKYEITLYNSVYNITEKYETTDTYYTCAVSKSGNYEVTVSAIGDGMNYLNSANAKAGEFKVEFTKKSIKDFLALEDDTTKGVESDYYLLTGKITNIANTQYGNFTLEAIDGSGDSIYVYGLSKTITQYTDQKYGTLGLTVGSLVAIAGYKTSYNSNPQVGGAVYLGEPELTALEQVALSDTKTSMILNYQVNKDVIYSYEFEKAEFKVDDEVNVETAKLKDITWTGNTATYYGFSSEKGMQIGSSKAAIATYTLTSTETFSNVKNIYLNLSGASKTDAKVTVTVGGKQIGETVNLTTSASIYEFASNEALSGAIVIKYEQTASAAVYIKSIEVTSGAPTYNMLSSSMRFGTKISKELYDEFAAQGAKWGVEIKAGEAAATQIACTPVRVNANGVEDANGEYYQFALVINKIGYANIDTVLTAKVFVEINNTKTYMNEASYSLRTLVDTYLAANDKSAYEDHLGVLNHLSSYGK